MNLKIEMHFSKSTKGTHVYSGDDTAIPSLYIKKEALPGTPPEKITVTIEVPT